MEPPMIEEKIVRTLIKINDLLYFEEIFRMIGGSFAVIINKFEKYNEFVKMKKIINLLALKVQLKALQKQSRSEKKFQFKKKEGGTIFVWDQAPSYRSKFQSYPTYSYSYSYHPNPKPIYYITVNPPRSRPNMRIH